MSDRHPLLKLRESRQMTLRELAEKAGVAPSTIHRWEQGKNPSLATVVAVAKALRVKIEAVAR